MAPQKQGPLNWKVPIANKDGTPTPEFIRKWQQQASINGTIPTLNTVPLVSAVLDVIGSTIGDLLVRGATNWQVLNPGTANRVLVDHGTGNTPSYVALSALMDTVFGNTRGALLYRGATLWSILAPGAATDVLTSNGAGADPTWQPAGGGGGGYAPGTPPTVVQVAWSTSATGATFATAPTSGNLIAAFVFNPNNNTTQAGWTKQIENATGADWGTILTKVAGASEPTLQQALATSATGGCVYYELNKAGGTPIFVAGVSQDEQVGVYPPPVFMPNVKDCIGIGAVSVVVATITAAYNVGTQDVLDNTGNRKLVAGHSDLGSLPLCGALANLSSSQFSKAATGLFT